MPIFTGVYQNLKPRRGEAVKWDSWGKSEKRFYFLRKFQRLQALSSVCQKPSEGFLDMRVRKPTTLRKNTSNF